MNTHTAIFSKIIKTHKRNLIEKFVTSWYLERIGISVRTDWYLSWDELVIKMCASWQKLVGTSLN